MSRYSRYLPVVKQVIKLATPVMLTNLLLTLVNVVDVFMVGRLGPLELASVGMASSIRMLVGVSILMVTTGAMTLAAQAKGARNPLKLSNVTRQTLILMVLISGVLSVIGYFIAEPALVFLNSGGDVRAVEMGTSYLQLLFLGMVFLAGNFAISSLMQGAGDTVTPLYLSIGINILNIGLNYVLIFGFGPIPAYGIEGAAIGTILSRFIGVAVGIAVIYSGRNVLKLMKGSYLPNWQMFSDILAIGIPAGIQGLVRNSAGLMLIKIVTLTPAGTFGAAAVAIGFQIESLVFMPGVGIKIAATSLVGQAVGAWQMAEARLRGNACIGFAVVVMGLMAIPIIIFAGDLIRLFEPSAHPIVMSAGTGYIVINSLFQPVLALSMITAGALAGAGDTRPALMGTFWASWVFRIPLAYFLAITLGLGVDGVWWAMGLSMIVSAIYVMYRWTGGKWRDVALKKTEVYRFHLKNLAPTVQQRFLDEVRTPMMALPDAQEKVDAESLQYQTKKENVFVHFDKNGYNLEAIGTD